MRQFFRVAIAFLRKDFLEESSYRAQFVLSTAFIAGQLVFLALLSGFVGPMVLEKTGFEGEYFDFVILGICAMNFLTTSLQELAGRIRRAQTLGTLEALLATRTGIPTLVVCLPLYSLVETTLSTLAYLLIGWTLFGLPFRPEGLLAAALVFAFMVVAFSCIGMVTAGLTIAFKRTQAINSAIVYGSMFLGGVWFPVETWGPWGRTIAQLLPITPALEGVRSALLNGSGVGDVAPQLVHLAVFVVLALPIGVAVFRWTLRRAMRDGTLTQY